MKGQSNYRSSFLLSYAGKEISVTIVKEKRNSCRVSVGKTGIIMRFPKSLSKTDEKNYYHRFLIWAKEQIDKRPQIFEKTPGRNYVKEPLLMVNDTPFHIRINQEQRKTYTWKRRQNRIFISTPLEFEPETVSAYVGSAVGNYFLPIITERIHFYNDSFFKKNTAKISIRNNSRVWGSCSSNGNLSFSSRLFFAPDDVVDYLVVHELSHLIHRNHSKAFWQTVEDCMPDYKEKEKWLRINGNTCFF